MGNSIGRIRLVADPRARTSGASWDLGGNYLPSNPLLGTGTGFALLRMRAVRAGCNIGQSVASSSATRGNADGVILLNRDKRLVGIISLGDLAVATADAKLVE